MKVVKGYLISLALGAFLIGCGGSDSSSATTLNSINLTNKITLSYKIATGSSFIDSNSNFYLGLNNSQVNVYKFLKNGDIKYITGISINNGIDRYTHIQVLNNKLYVIGKNNGVNVYDVTNLTSPQLLVNNTNYFISSDSWSNPQEKFLIKNNFIIGIFNKKLMTLEVNNNDLSSSFSYGSDYNEYEQISVGSDENKNYLLNQDSDGMHVFDINDAKSPVKLSDITNIHFKKYTILNDYYLIGITNEGIGSADKLVVVNISDKKNPFIENSLTNPHGLGSFDDYFIDNGNMFTLSDYAGATYLDIYDISNLPDVNLSKSYKISGYDTAPVRMFEKNGNIYLYGADKTIYYFKKPF